MDQFIDKKQLTEMAGGTAVQKAKKAMDSLSVHTYKFDKRGRIEAGIRPAANSGEKNSYSKITKRGQRYLPECLLHGRGKWCVHSIILALHQIGEQPEYHVRKPQKKQLNSDPASHFKLIMTIQPSLAVFKILHTEQDRFVPDIRSFLNASNCLTNLTPSAAEALREHDTRENRAQIHVEKQDMATVLFELWKGRDKGLKLNQNSSSHYDWNDLIAHPPSLEVELTEKKLNWKWVGNIPHQGDIFFPGRPGFRIRGNTITMFSYFGHLQPFVLETRGSMSGQALAENLHFILTEKHQINWKSPQPHFINDAHSFSLKLAPSGHHLKGQMGITLNQTFIPLESTRKKRQILKKNTYLSLSENKLNQLRRGLQQIGVPPEQPQFLIRSQMVDDFLLSKSFPSDWNLLRSRTDNWFGTEKKVCRVRWNIESESEPSYDIDGQIFKHQSLMDHLMASRQGVQLANGQILSFDTRELLVNHDLISSLKRAFPEEKQRLFLLRNIRSQREIKPAFVIPEKWKCILRHYQTEGVEWMLQLKEVGLSGLLADDMGLGKTIQTLSFLAITKGELPQLVIVPRTLLFNWQSECKAFSPERKVVIHHGSKRSTTPEALQKADLVITTYGTLLRDEDLFYDIHFDSVVIDEAQLIKNPKSKTAQAVFELWAESKLALTGTPIENSLDELWSIFHFIAPDFLGDRELYRGYFPKNAPFILALKQKIRPFLLRRTKETVLKELPPKQEITIKLPLSSKQNDIYKSFLDQAKKNLPEQKPTVPSILTTLLRLRQICCHPGLVSDEFLTAESTKFEFLLDALKKNQQDGQAALVFSQFTKLLNLFKFNLEDADIPYLYLDGKTPQRQKLIDRFQQGEAPVFLISLKAGGVGLNLTRASYVYHLDPWWNPMVEKQATDRVHRIGQTRCVFSYKLLTENTLEEAILHMQGKKLELASSIWDTDGQQTQTQLNRDELLDLLVNLNEPRLEPEKRG
ncbi:MAG: hypothetical protein CSA81_06970 [Acidobacteria bacterium]|nr:MAG: hypothetical protein CSA81_06970 [Acidobacteriota bacterium]